MSSQLAPSNLQSARKKAHTKPAVPCFESFNGSQQTSAALSDVSDLSATRPAPGHTGRVSNWAREMELVEVALKFVITRLVATGLAKRSPGCAPNDVQSKNLPGLEAGYLSRRLNASATTVERGTARVCSRRVNCVVSQMEYCPLHVRPRFVVTACSDPLHTQTANSMLDRSMPSARLSAMA